MNVEELHKLLTMKGGSRKKPRHRESEIQQACVEWFRLSYPHYIIAAIPNGGSRNVIEAANMKREGVLAGFADLIIICDHKILFVEMKTPKGRQQETQKEFQRKVEALGFHYVVCRSFEEFKTTVTNWLGRAA